MHTTKRTLLALAALLAIMVLAACGGGDGGDEASSETDVDTLLEETFSGGYKKFESGKLELSLKASANGETFDVSLTGPFENEGADKLPKIALQLEATGSNQNIQAGATNTGEKGFVSFNGENYVLSDEVFTQFKQGFEEAAKQNQEDEKQSLASLGLNPKDWLTNPENAGEGEVGDTEVIRITGGLDVPKFLDDLNAALSKAGQLGVPQGQVPTQLTDEQRKQVEDAIEDVKVEIATGKEDSILRQMKVDLSAKDPDGGDTATINFDFQILDLNEGQEFPEPENAKPFDELLGQLGGLGGLSGLGGGAGADAGGAGSGSTGGASQEQLDQYSQCLEDAGSDLTKAQECASLLQG